MMAQLSGRIITIVDRDQVKHPMPAKSLAVSKFFRGLMENHVASDEIPMPHVSPAILGVVCDYLVYHTETPPTPIPQPLPSNELSDFLDEFDAKLVDRKETEVFELLLAANYFDIPSLVSLCLAKIASWMKGKTVDEVKDLFRIRKDSTSTEEQELLKRFGYLL